MLRRLELDGGPRVRYLECSPCDATPWVDPGTNCELVAVDGLSRHSNAAAYLGSALRWSRARRGLIVLGEDVRSHLTRRVALIPEALVNDIWSIPPLAQGQVEIIVGGRGMDFSFDALERWIRLRNDAADADTASKVPFFGYRVGVRHRY